MNYRRLYENIIDNAKNRLLPDGEYFERHHIKPKCIGGQDTIENLVDLTLREHFLCHWLLHKIHPTNIKLLYAWNCFCMNNRNMRMKSKNYEYARRKFIKAMREFHITNPEQYKKKAMSCVGKVWMNNGSKSVRVE